jgi:hypothetical protein
MFMKKRHYYILLFTSLAVLLIGFYGMLSLAMAKKFELKNPTDCISLVTGQDLCLWQNVLYGIIAASTLLLLFCVYKVALDIRPKNQR